MSELREIIEASESPKVRVNQLEKRSDGKLIIDLSVEAPKWLPLYTPNGEYYWKLKMPGSITAHNAREISGNDLKWTTTRDNGMFRIHAESQVQ